MVAMDEDAVLAPAGGDAAVEAVEQLEVVVPAAAASEAQGAEQVVVKVRCVLPLVNDVALCWRVGLGWIGG